LRIAILNPTAYDYQDIDLTIQLNEPVVATGQTTKFPGVTFLEPSVSVNMVEIKGNKAGALSLIPVASLGSKRVRIEKLPSKSNLEIIFANANVNPSFPDIVDIKMSNGDRYWYVNREILGARPVEDVYLASKPKVNLAKVNGKYTVLQRKKDINLELNVK
jgi:hypothetical protein